MVTSLRQDAVVLPHTSRRRTSWAQFVTDYGNMLGAHAGSTVPQVLEQVTFAKGPNGHMAGYLLRAAAVVAERSLAAVLRDLGGSAHQPVRSGHPPGVAVLALSIGDGPNPWHAFDLRCDETDREVLRMPFGDKTLVVGWVWWDPSTSTGSATLTVSKEAPLASDLAAH